MPRWDADSFVDLDEDKSPPQPGLKKLNLKLNKYDLYLNIGDPNGLELAIWDGLEWHSFKSRREAYEWTRRQLDPLSKILAINLDKPEARQVMARYDAKNGAWYDSSGWFWHSVVVRENIPEILEKIQPFLEKDKAIDQAISDVYAEQEQRIEELRLERKAFYDHWKDFAEKLPGDVQYKKRPYLI